MAHYEVTLNQDNLAKGAEVQVHGLGILINGKTVEFSKEQHEFFRTANQVWEPELDGDGNPKHDDEGRELGAFVPGPTLKQAAKTFAGELEVEYYTDKDEENLEEAQAQRAAEKAKASEPETNSGQQDAVTKPDDVPAPDPAPAPGAKSVAKKTTGGDK